MAIALALFGHTLLFWWGSDWSWRPEPPEGTRQAPMQLALSARPAPEQATGSETRPPPQPERAPTQETTAATDPRPATSTATAPDPEPGPEPEAKPVLQPSELKPELEPEPPKAPTKRPTASSTPKPPPEPPRQIIAEAVEPTGESAEEEPAEEPTSAQATATTIAPTPPINAGEAASTPAGRETTAATTGEIIEAHPLYRENPPPPYPRAAQRRHHQGTVILEVLVNRQGRVEELQVAESSGYPLLDRAAANAVADWRFEPGRRNDQAVASRVLVPVRFALQ